MKLNELVGTAPQSNSNPTLTQLVVTQMLAKSPFLSHLEFYQMSGNSDKLTAPATSVKSGRSRNINEDYPNRFTTYNEYDIALRIYGDLIKTDIAYERRFSSKTAVASERTRQLIQFAKDLAVGMEIASFKDKATNSGEMSGIISLIDPAQTKVFCDASNGEIITLGNTDDDIMMALKLKEEIYSMLARLDGEASLMTMPKEILTRLALVCGRDIQRTSYANAVGDPIEITTFANVPVLGMVNKDANGNAAMAMNETVGTSTNCGSIVAMRFGEKVDLTAATNSGIYVFDDGKVGTAYQTQVELDMGLGLQNKRAVASITGIRLNSQTTQGAG